MIECNLKMRKFHDDRAHSDYQFRRDLMDVGNIIHQLIG
jgi:hypothetical protein